MEQLKQTTPAAGPAGTGILVGKDGPQLIRSTGQRWSAEAEERFLDTLAASCNVSAAAEAAGFTRFTCYKRRRRDPGFAKLWDAALDQGAARIRALLLQRAGEALEGFAPDPDTPIPTMTVSEALSVLAAHDRRISGGPRSRREWARPRSLDEMRDSILRKLAAVAPAPQAPESPSRPSAPLKACLREGLEVGASDAGSGETAPPPAPAASGRGDVPPPPPPPPAPPPAPDPEREGRADEA